MAFNVLIPERNIQCRTRQMADEVTDFYGRDVDNLLLIFMLTGAVPFFVDLSRELNFRGVRHQYRPMGVSTQNSDQTSHAPVVWLDINEPIENKHVLLVEDIIDTGWTLAYVMDLLAGRGPLSLEMIVMLSKDERREAPIKPRWIGHHIPDRYVIGYGLDDGTGKHRDLRDVCYVA